MEGLFMKAVSQTAFLALADLRRQLGSPHSAISFVGSIVFVGFLFWLLASFSIDHFLNAAFLMVPILILAPATSSVYVGFGLALIFVIGPWFLPYYVMAMPPDTASLGMRVLHFSPMMAALDATGTGLLVAENPLPALLATLAVVVILVALGLLVYRRFQSAEGWAVGRAKLAPDQNGAAFFRLNVTAVPLQVRSLPIYEGLPEYALIPMELTADGTRLLFYNEMNVSGPVFDRNIVWIIVGLEAAIVLGRRLTRRPRRAQP